MHSMHFWFFVRLIAQQAYLDKNFSSEKLCKRRMVTVLGMCGKVLVAGEAFRCGFCQKLLENSSNDNASRVQDGPATGQG